MTKAQRSSGRRALHDLEGSLLSGEEKGKEKKLKNAALQFWSI
jgi:hypothetical protein